MATENNADTPTSQTFWYFAIGSMMNPISIKNRNIVPLESVAGEIFGFKISFFSKMGFAVADPSDDKDKSDEGESFHGVLHHVDEPTMKELDNIEVAYDRTPAKARRRDTNEIVDCYVYTHKDPNRERGPHVDSPPHERYMEIMIAGAEHYKVDPEYISWLKNHPFQARPTPEEFANLGSVPHDAPVISVEDLKAMDGRDGQPLCGSVNGKVVKYIADPNSTAYKRFCDTIQAKGNVWDMFFAKLGLDLKYGTPERLEDFTREHGAYLEHQTVWVMEEIPEFLGRKEDWEVIGSLERPWKDE